MCVLSTLGGVQDMGGHHEYIRGCSVYRKDIMIRVGGYHEDIRGVQYIGGIP